MSSRATDGLAGSYFGDRKMGMMKVHSDRLHRNAREPSPSSSRPGSTTGRAARQTEVINAHDHLLMMHPRSARLALMDEQGLEATLLFRLGGRRRRALDPRRRHRRQLYANLRAFNRWLEEDWGYGADGRIFAAPMLSLLRPAHAVAELTGCWESGRRCCTSRLARSTAGRRRTPPRSVLGVGQRGRPAGRDPRRRLRLQRALGGSVGRAGPAATAIDDPVHEVPGLRRQAALGHLGEPGPQ